MLNNILKSLGLGGKQLCDNSKLYMIMYFSSIQVLE